MAGRLDQLSDLYTHVVFCRAVANFYMLLANLISFIDMR